MMITNKKILVVAGGWSPEKNVSLSTGKNVYKALKKLNFNVIFFKLNKKNLSKIITFKPYIIFNALHGEFGEDGGLTCYAHNNNIKITHSNQVSSSLCLDKQLTKNLISKLTNINIPKSYSFDSKINFPVIIKPNKGGSSVGIKLIKNNLQYKKLDKLSNNLIIEEYISGTDLTVTVIEKNNKIKALAVTSINFNSEIYDYKSKYTKGLSTHTLPADIPTKDYNYLLKLSEKLFKLLNCSSIARFDFVSKKIKGINHYYFLEANTHPGLTNLSLSPEQANFIGLNYEELIKLILESTDVN